MGPNFLRHPPLYNAILSKLPVSELEAIRPFLRVSRLVVGQILLEPGQAIDHVYFVDEGVVSLMVEPPGMNQAVQVAMIGSEGLVGGDTLLDVNAVPFSSAVVQIAGTAQRLSVRDLHSLLQYNREFQSQCFAYVAVHVGQIMQTSASNARNTVAGRCIRWVLMTHERMQGGAVSTTHEALSAMLGIRRAGVTRVLTGLQGDGLISLQRGRITVLDRVGLELAINRSF